jgi:hypothetical protein
MRPRRPPASGPAPGAAAAGHWPRRRRSSWYCGCRPAGRRRAGLKSASLPGSTVPKNSRSAWRCAFGVFVALLYSRRLEPRLSSNPFRMKRAGCGKKTSIRSAAENQTRPVDWAMQRRNWRRPATLGGGGACFAARGVGNKRGCDAWPRCRRNPPHGQAAPARARPTTRQATKRTRVSGRGVRVDHSGYPVRLPAAAPFAARRAVPPGAAARSVPDRPGVPS